MVDEVAIRGNGIFVGTTSIDEMADQLEVYAAHLRELRAEGSVETLSS